MDNPEIGQLRWLVTLAQETQAMQADGPGVDVGYVALREVYANIVPVGTATYLLGVQVEVNAITHRITIRYQDDLSEFDLLIRDRTRPDGTLAHQVFRVHRSAEIGGRQRFLSLDCELRGPQ